MAIKGRARPRRLIALLILLFLGGSLLWRIEPLEPRYEGKTLRGWFREASATGEPPPMHVVRHYGLGATEFLLRQVAPPPVPLPIAWEERYFEWLSDRPVYRAAVIWLGLLANLEPTPVPSEPKKTAGSTK